jgi:small GTP-binding protein
MSVIQKKVCLLGDFAVGKTSLVRRFVEGRFDDRYLSTIGVKISRKSLIRPDHTVNLLVWDLAGGDEHNDNGTGYLRGAAGALIVCDLTRRETMAGLTRYTQQVRLVNPTAQIVLLANKVDLTEERQISAAELDHLASQLACPVLHTSAKTGQGVAEGFEQLAQLLVTINSS